MNYDTLVSGHRSGRLRVGLAGAGEFGRSFLFRSGRALGLDLVAVADRVVGPILQAKAAAAGLVCTLVDGDQPSLLVALVSWARLLEAPVSLINAVHLRAPAARLTPHYDMHARASAASRRSKRMTAALSASDQRKLFHDNAARFYRL